MFFLFLFLAYVVCSKVYLVNIIDGLSQDALRKYLPNAEYIMKEIFADGMMFTDARISQYVSQTAVSHPSIYTGAPPGVHSVVAESWTDRLTGQSVLAYHMDDVVTTAGESTDDLANGPGKMIGSTYMDEFKRQNPDGEAVLSGTKDRSGFMAGHKGVKPHAFHWGCDLPASAGQYYSTSYFMDVLEEHTIAFNAELLTKFVGPLRWELEYDLEKYVNKDTDKGSGFWTAEIEGQTFPRVYDVDGEGPANCRYPSPGKDYTGFMNSEFGIQVGVDMVKSEIAGRNIGKRGVDDFYQINWSEFDYIGHFDGPNSLSHEDAFYKTDKGLREIVDFLLARGVLRKDIVIMITGDHGMGDIVEDKQELGFPYAGTTQEMMGELCGGQWDTDETNILDECVNQNSLIYKINEAVKEKVGIDYNVITEVRKTSRGKWKVEYPTFGKSFVTFVPEIQTEDFLYTVESIVADMITRHPMFAKAVTRSDIVRGYVNDEAFVVGFHPENSGNVMLSVEQDVYHWPVYRSYGLVATHGSRWGYDNNIPLVFWGWEIPSGVCDKTVYHSSIAPTLARIGGWGKTTGGSGEILKEVVTGISFTKWN